MVEIFEKNYDFLSDKEIKFAQDGIANVVQNYSFLDIKIDFQQIRILKTVIVEQKKKRNSKTNKYIIVGFNLIETAKDKRHNINENIKKEALSNNDKIDNKLKIIFEPMLIQNDPQVQYVLGFTYTKGQYVACGIDKAIHYYSLSVNQNYSKEQLKFRVICNKSKGYRSKRDFIMKKLNDFPDGTYDYNTGDPIDYSGQKKFQVAFQTTASEDKTSEKYLTNDQYDALVEVYSWLTGSKPYLGKFEVAEISFLCDSFELAMKIAKKHNQKSIWSWEIMDEIQNPDYDPTKNLVKAGKKNKRNSIQKNL